jgi:hypothetical protein
MAKRRPWDRPDHPVTGKDLQERKRREEGWLTREEAIRISGRTGEYLSKLASENKIRTKMFGFELRYYAASVDVLRDRTIVERKLCRKTTKGPGPVRYPGLPKVGVVCERDREGCLYLFEVGDVVKIGVTTDPGVRLREHARTAGAFGLEYGRHWVSEPHVEAYENESELVGDSHREWVRAPFDELLKKALALPMTPATVTSISPQLRSSLHTASKR